MPIYAWWVALYKWTRLLWHIVYIGGKRNWDENWGWEKKEIERIFKEIEEKRAGEKYIHYSQSPSA